MNQAQWKTLRRNWLIRWLPPLFTSFLRILYRTLRLRIDMPRKTEDYFRSGKPVIWAFWHGRLLVMPYLFHQVLPNQKKAWILISQHWDGELIARIVKPFGISSIRGSSTRGGQRAFRELIKKTRNCEPVALTPDGPKGPRYKVQPGLLKLAQLTGAPIVTVSCSSMPRLRARSWDRFQIPLPFSRLSAAFGEPFYIPRDSSNENMEAYGQRLEKQLNHQTQSTEVNVRNRYYSKWLYFGYNMLLALISLLALPLVVYKVARESKLRAGFIQRIGLYRITQALRKISDRPLWVHAVSVGEVLATVPFVRKLKKEIPQIPIVVSTITPTGREVAENNFPNIEKIIYFPFDYPYPVVKSLKMIQPRIFIHTETEIWPNFLFLLGHQGIPSAIVNGRISTRSCRQYGWFRFFFKQVLSSISVFGMQTKDDCLRIIRIGADPRRVFITGNMKFDMPLMSNPQSEVVRIRKDMGFSDNDVIFVAGSTHAGEEKILLEAFQKIKAEVPQIKLLLAPRHPERCPEVEGMILGMALTIKRRTQFLSHGGFMKTDVLLLDTMGELAKAYSIGDIIFVGGSLVPIGGHNVLEPIIYHKPVLFGPHTENFADIIYELKRTGGGIEIYDGESLCREAMKLLKDKVYREEIGFAAHGILEEHRGATERNFEIIQKLLRN